MGKSFRRVFLSSAFRKTLFGYAVTILLVTTIVLSIMTGVVVSMFRESSLEQSKQMMQQLVNSSERVQDEVNIVFSIVTSDSKTLQFVQRDTDNKVENYELFLRLKTLMGAYPFITDITVVNFESGVAVHAIGSEYSLDMPAVQFVTENLEQQRSIVSRTITNAGKTQNTVAFLENLPYNNCAVVIDVKASWLQYSVGEEQREVFIIDANGEPISENTRAGSGDSSEKLFAMLEELDTDDVYADESTGALYFFRFSEELEWWFIDKQDYSQFYNSLIQLMLTFVLIAVALLAVCTGISVFFGQRLQKPLRQLVNKCRTAVGMDTVSEEDEMLFIDKTIAKVEHERYRSEQYMRTQFLSNLIRGHEMPFLLSRESVAGLRQQFAAPYYAVLLMQFQPKVEIEADKRAEEYRILRYTVCNLADELFGASFRCKTAETDENRAAVLLMLDTETISDEYQLCFSQLRSFAEKEIGIILSGGLGPVVSEQSEIAFSYMKAKSYLDMNRVVNRGELVDFTNAAGASYQEKNEKLVASIEEYARLHFADPELSLKSIAQHFDLSSAYLGKIFKAVKGQSFAAFLMQGRLELSRTALLETGKTVAEIAAQTGFSNATYFTTAFKNAYGMMPTAFRNKAK